MARSMRCNCAEKLVVPALTVALTVFSSYSSLAEPVDMKGKAALTKPGTADGQKHKGRHRAGKSGDHKQHRRDAIPSFRAIRQLDSLTPVQQAEVNTIIKQAKGESKPYIQRLRQIRRESGGADDSAYADDSSSHKAMQSGEGRMTRSATAKLRREIYEIRASAWRRLQKVLTAHQKIELESLRGTEPQGRHPKESFQK